MGTALKYGYVSLRLEPANHRCGAHARRVAAYYNEHFFLSAVAFSQEIELVFSRHDCERQGLFLVVIRSWGCADARASLQRYVESAVYGQYCACNVLCAVGNQKGYSFAHISWLPNVAQWDSGIFVGPVHVFPKANRRPHKA